MFGLELGRFVEVESLTKRSSVTAGLELRCRKAHVLLPVDKPFSVREGRAVGGLRQEHRPTVPRDRKALSLVMLPSLLWDLERGSVAKAASTERRLEVTLGGVDDCRALVGATETAPPFPPLRLSVLLVWCGAAKNGILDLTTCLLVPLVSCLLGEMPLIFAARGAFPWFRVSCNSLAKPESGLSGDIFQEVLLALPYSPGCGVLPPVLAIFRGGHFRELPLPNSPSEVSLLLSAGAPLPPLELVESSLQCEILDGVRSRS